jgi:hypothetical protein
MGLILFYKFVMIMRSKKITSYTFILLFSFFSAFAMNVVLVDFNPICAEESINSDENDLHVNNSQSNFLFLDEIHHEELALFAPVIFPINFLSKLILYRSPDLNSPIIPPQV